MTKSNGSSGMQGVDKRIFREGRFGQASDSRLPSRKMWCQAPKIRLSQLNKLYSMDRLNQQRTLIKKNLTDYAQTANKSPDGVETQLVFDEERDHYMAFRTGWWRKKRIHSAVIYVRLQNDKIWIEEDWTEEGIATELLEAGVAKEEIVLAFHHPTMRRYSEFAMA